MKQEIQDRLAQIKKRVQEATYGPWAWEAYGEKENAFHIGVAMDKHENFIEGKTETERYDPDTNIFVEDILWHHDIGDRDGATVNYGDADFITHARTDIPWLVELIEKLLASANGKEST